MATTFHHHFHENILSTIHHHHLSSLCSRTTVLLVFTSLLVLLLSSSPPRPVNASDASVFSQSNDGQTPHLVPVSYCEQLCQVHKCNSNSNSSSDNYKSSKVFSKWSHFSRSKRQTANAEAPADKVKLTVSAGPSQTIQLPVDQAVLTSFVLPDSKNYKYSWELVYPLNQVDIGNIEGLNKDQVKVSHLKPGNYTFRVTVTGGDKPNDGGSATVGLTVLPPATAHHRPPIVVIEPNAQTVQLPNKDAVLDGSASRSPDAADGTTTIVRYDWAAIKVPIGYKNLLPLNSSILRLKDLTPGLYVFNLTVTDSRNATNSTTASVTVLKEADYPPVANAGPDIVVYLPQNSVTLNGSASTDDKGIESWQWSRADDGGGGGSGGSGGSGSGGPGGGGGGSGSGSTAAVDMDGTSTAFLHLSNLQVGVYKFVLQVTDTSGQSSRAETHVFVKPESNEAPRADAGGDLELRLPLTPESAVLDGSKSADDIAIVRWEWLQIDGPKSLTLLDSNTSVARIAPNSLVGPGRYNFSLTVWDVKNLSSTAFKTVTVIQDRNIPPKAVGGGDRTVTLPTSEVVLDGSASYDDAEIVAFRWERMPRSLAYGEVLGNSSLTPVLRLGGLAVPGRYLFQLTVTDAHGASASDLVSLIVRPPADVLSTVELVLNYDVASFTAEQQATVLRRVEAILGERFGASVRVRAAAPVERTRERRTVLLAVAADSNGNPLASGEVVRAVRGALKVDPGRLSLQVITVESYVCQNDCSGHGSCDPYSRRCMCEAFWMENWLRVYFGDNQSNCEWSILYVIIICSACVLSATVVLWLCICLLSRRHLLLQTGRSHHHHQHRHYHQKPTYHNGRSGGGGGIFNHSVSSGGESGGSGRKRSKITKRTNRFRYMLIDSCDNVEMVATTQAAAAAAVDTPNSSTDDDDEQQQQRRQQVDSDASSSEMLFDSSKAKRLNRNRTPNGVVGSGGGGGGGSSSQAAANKLNAIT